MKIVFDDNIMSRLKYPDGKKDGNKLGARKRRTKVYDVIVLASGTVIMHPSMKGKI